MAQNIIEATSAMQASAREPSEATQSQQKAELHDQETQALLPAHWLSPLQPATSAAQPVELGAPASPGRSRTSAQQTILDDIKATLQVSRMIQLSASDIQPLLQCSKP